MLKTINVFIYFEMATSAFEEQRIIIRFLHLCGIKLIKIHQQLSETCNDGVMRPCNLGVSVVKNVYVYRVITLRNDCIFSFLWWVAF